MNPGVGVRGVFNKASANRGTRKKSAAGGRHYETVRR